MLAEENGESECLIIYSRSLPSLLYLEMIRFIVSIVFRVEKKNTFQLFGERSRWDLMAFEC